MKQNPANDVEMLNEDAGEGFPAWTEEEIAQFETYWPIGSQERLAFAVLLHTGLRRGDAANLGKPHFGKDNVIMLKPAKTERASGITVHSELVAAINACQPRGLFMIETEAGKRRVKEGFDNWFAEIARKAGIEKNCHGLRKSCAMRVAQAGATEAQMMAFFGWTDPQDGPPLHQGGERQEACRRGLQEGRGWRRDWSICFRSSADRENSR